MNDVGEIVGDLPSFVGFACLFDMEFFVFFKTSHLDYQKAMALFCAGIIQNGQEETDPEMARRQM